MWPPKGQAENQMRNSQAKKLYSDRTLKLEILMTELKIVGGVKIVKTYHQ